MKATVVAFLLLTSCYFSQCSPVDDYNYQYDDYNYLGDDDEDYAHIEADVDIFDENVCDCEDDIFEPCDCKKVEPIECFNSVNEIDDSVFEAADTRQAFEDCKNQGQNPISTTCEDYADEGYVCSPLWTCQDKNNTIITDGEGIIDVRDTLKPIPGECAVTKGILDSTDRKCLKENEVCCKKPNLTKKPCNETESTDNNYSQCGRSLESGLTITGGEFDKENYAQPGEFPHMCIVYKDVNGNRIYVGGASLIATNKLLTVAHKFWLTKKGQVVNDLFSPEQFVVRCGEQNVRNEAEVLPHQETQVKKIHIHPDYNSRKVKNNLAILETVDNFVYQKHIGPVCLPGVDSKVFEGKTECWSSGWGSDTYSSNDNTKYSDNLKKLKMPVVDLRTCENKLREHTRLMKTFRVHKSWICVGGEGTDTCSGDGGSPHVCKNDNGRFVQVGAVNWGLGCGEAVPSVYSSVPDAMCWIDKIMSCLSKSTSDIDTEIEDYDIRGTAKTRASANKLSSANCEAWNEDHKVEEDSRLQECTVKYKRSANLDERTVGDGDDIFEDEERGR